MKSSTLVLITSIVFCFNTQAFGKAAFLSGFDDVTTQNEAIRLQVKLEKKSLIPYRTDIPGETIHFYLNNKLIGSDITDYDGLAKLEVRSMPIGNYEFKATIEAGSIYKSKMAELFHIVIDENAPIAISDIDHTISDASATRVVTSRNSSLKPLKHAVKGIQFFHDQGFQLIYLTARDDTFILKTKEWLKMYNFIKAPSFYWDYKGAGVPQDHGDYKSLMIKNLKNKFHNVLIGIGDKPHDIRAYRDHGLRSYYIGVQNLEINKDAIKVQSWDLLMKHFQAFPLGSLSTDPLIN